MIVAVVDTNVLVSAAIDFKESASVPGAILRRWRRGDFELVMSDGLLLELEDVLARPYFVQRIGTDDTGISPASFRGFCVVTELTIDVQGVAPDPDDDHVIAAAVSAGVNYLVTGDRKLRGVESYEGVQFVTPREFVDILDAARA